MPDFVRQFCSSFEEIHYFVGGVSVGMIIGIIITIVIVKILSNIFDD